MFGSIQNFFGNLFIAGILFAFLWFILSNDDFEYPIILSPSGIPLIIACFFLYRFFVHKKRLGSQDLINMQKFKLEAYEAWKRTLICTACGEKFLEWEAVEPIPQVRVTTVPNQSDRTEKLLKLKELLNDGDISPTEYEDLKRELLS